VDRGWKGAAMTTIATVPVSIDAGDIEPGELVWFLGEAHRITTIEPYKWREGWRIASDATGWAITFIPGERLEVLR
jgi:hypothetical protein